MAYTIRYGTRKSPQKKRLILLSTCFFILFLLFANLVFSSQLKALQDLIISPEIQEAVAVFCEDILDNGN